MSNKQESSVSGLPTVFKRFILKLRFGKNARKKNTPLYNAHSRLSIFRTIVDIFDKYGPPPYIVFFVKVLLSAYLASEILIIETETPLSSMVTSGLLIAPLIGMLNGGFTSIINLYLSIFSEDSNQNTKALEPRFNSLKLNVAFIRKIINFGDEKDDLKKYAAYAQETIEKSVQKRKDVAYRSDLSTVGMGIIILSGYLFLMVNLVPVSLFLMVYIYIVLISRNLGVFRTAIKQSTLEDFVKEIKEEQERNTPSGIDFFSSVR